MGETQKELEGRQGIRKWCKIYIQNSQKEWIKFKNSVKGMQLFKMFYKSKLIFKNQKKENAIS